jgi:hypothetical protein
MVLVYRHKASGAVALRHKGAVAAVASAAPVAAVASKAAAVALRHKGAAAVASAAPVASNQPITIIYILLTLIIYKINNT